MIEMVDLQTYHHFVIALSGGKDSLSCFTQLLDLGVPRDKIELWHHLVDGPHDNFMDWPVTRDYCRKMAGAFGVRIYYSWKEAGYRGELCRDNEKTKPTRFEMPHPESDSIIECSTRGKLGKKSTPRKFPQSSSNLSVRWCTAYLKIDVADKALANQARFRGKKILFVTGERAEESAARSNYAEFEPHRADLRNGKRNPRLIDHWRPVHSWPEQKVWEAMEKHRIVPHPAYRLGWGRLSCISCIFGSRNQWASLYHIDPQRVTTLADHEKEFGYTIHREMDLWEQIARGIPYDGMDSETVGLGLSRQYTGKIFTDRWTLPKGAFGESAGPT